MNGFKWIRSPRRVISVALVVVVAAAALRVALWRPQTIAQVAAAERRLSGVIHVHTSLSDGRGTPDRVIAAAKAAGLDYVVITDHGGFGAKHLEGYSDDLLVIVGIEISTRAGHILAFGLPDPAFRFSDDPLEVLEDVHYLGGAAVIAHPDSPRTDFAWTDWNLAGQWGMEILNGDTELRSVPWLDAAQMLTAYPLNSQWALLQILHRPDHTFERWDRLLADRNVSAIVGADAHGFPSYESVFKLARNHVLVSEISGNAGRDIAAVVSALRRGASYIAIDALAPATGFSFVAEEGGREWSMGAVVPLTPSPLLRAGGTLPPGARVALYRNGQLLEEGSGIVQRPASEAGAYRSEVHLPDWDVPWIVSNPIYVVDSAEQQARQQRQRPTEPIAAEPADVLEDFEGTGPFGAVSDVSSVANWDVLETSPTNKAGRLTFKLGARTPATPSPFVAVVGSGRRDLTRRKGLVFSVKGDQVYRMWVQVRDQNPRSDEGTEWWYASVRTSNEWQRIALPFERLRTRDSRTDGRLDLDKTTGIYFILDLGVAKPATEGMIWLDDIALF